MSDELETPQEKEARIMWGMDCANEFSRSVHVYVDSGTSAIRTAQDARNEFEDVMADYSTFINDGEPLTDRQKQWLRSQEKCVRAAVRDWVTLLGGAP